MFENILEILNLVWYMEEIMISRTLWKGMMQLLAVAGK